ncbi:MAG: DUF4936 family protein [Clostridia bacterium]
MNYYVYYKLSEAQVRALSASVEKLFEKVRQKTGVQGRWIRRRDDPSTYMEVYEGVKDQAGFEALLEQESRGFGVERRVERFVLCSELES